MRFHPFLAAAASRTSSIASATDTRSLDGAARRVFLGEGQARLGTAYGFEDATIRLVRAGFELPEVAVGISFRAALALRRIQSGIRWPKK